MATFYTADIWKITVILSKPGNSFSIDEDAVDVSVTYEEDKFMTRNKGVRVVHASMQCMIESVLHIFQKRTLDRHIETFLEMIIVSLLDRADHEAAMREKKPVYQAAEKVLTWLVARDVLIEAILMYLVGAAKLQEFLQ